MQVQCKPDLNTHSLEKHLQFATGTIYIYRNQAAIKTYRVSFERTILQPMKANTTDTTDRRNIKILFTNSRKTNQTIQISVQPHLSNFSDFSNMTSLCIITAWKSKDLINDLQTIKQLNKSNIGSPDIKSQIRVVMNT